MTEAFDGSLGYSPRAARLTASMSPRWAAMMIGAMHALREADVAVPGRMALVGFDDFDWAEYVSPRLTVLAQPLEEIGTRAVDLLMRRIAEPGGDYSVHRLAPALRIRDSCGCSG